MKAEKRQTTDMKVIEKMKASFGFDCELTYIGKKYFGGSKITTYYFKDELGIVWEYDVNPRTYRSLAYGN